MIDAPEVLLHACALCGKPAALPVAGGMQLSAHDTNRRVIAWAVHPECLSQHLTPIAQLAFDQAFART